MPRSVFRQVLDDISEVERRELKRMISKATTQGLRVHLSRPEVQFLRSVLHGKHYMLKKLKPRMTLSIKEAFDLYEALPQRSHLRSQFKRLIEQGALKDPDGVAMGGPPEIHHEEHAGFAD